MALYAYARTMKEPARAQAAVRGFFAFVRDRKLGFGHAENRDRLRSFLLSAFQDYLDAERAPYGPKDPTLDFSGAERWFQSESAAGGSPETTFHRAWARCILRQSYAVLKEELTSQHGRETADLVAAEVSPLVHKPFNPDLAPRLSVSPSDLLHVLKTARLRLRDLLLHTIRETVSAQSDVEIEFWDLFKSV